MVLSLLHSTINSYFSTMYFVEVTGLYGGISHDESVFKIFFCKFFFVNRCNCWHEVIEEKTIDDTILDRIVHDAHWVDLKENP